jgi:hypothetical protein
MDTQVLVELIGSITAIVVAVITMIGVIVAAKISRGGPNDPPPEKEQPEGRPVPSGEEGFRGHDGKMFSNKVAQLAGLPKELNGTPFLKKPDTKALQAIHSNIGKPAPISQSTPAC